MRIPLSSKAGPAAGRGDVDRNWAIPIAAMLCLSVSSGIFLLFNFGVFIKHIADDLQATTGEVSLAILIAASATLLIMPFVGRMVDRIGARPIVIGSVVLLSLSLAFVSAARSLLHLYIAATCASVLGVGTTPITLTRIISNWFDARRGLALGVTLTGIGVGATVFPLTSQQLIDAYGWRQAFLLLSATPVALALPLAVFVLRDHPASVRHGAAPEARRFSFEESTRVADRSSPLEGDGLKDALKTWRFWLLGLAVLLMAASIPGVVVHLTPLLTEHGLDATLAAGVASALGASIIVGRIATGFLLDRYRAALVSLVVLPLATAGVFLLAANPTTALVFIGAIAVGIGMGAEFDFVAYLVGRYFGLRSYGEIYGVLFALLSLGSGLGPAIVGAMRDATGSYAFLPLFITPMIAVICIILFRLGPYKYAPATLRR